MLLMKCGFQIFSFTAADNAHICLQYAQICVNLLAICLACISMGTFNL